jgi:hypothetical protein
MMKKAARKFRGKLKKAPLKYTLEYLEHYAMLTTLHHHNIFISRHRK